MTEEDQKQKFQPELCDPEKLAPLKVENPYIVGRCLRAEDEALFYGRGSLLEETEKNLEAGKDVVLVAPRRMGKTSFLYRLRVEDQHRQPPNLCVLLDLQRIPVSTEGLTETKLFNWIHQTIVDDLNQQGIKIARPESESQINPKEKLQATIQQIDEQLGDRRLTLMLDEFRR